MSTPQTFAFSKKSCHTCGTEYAGLSDARVSRGGRCIAESENARVTHLQRLAESDANLCHVEHAVANWVEESIVQVGVLVIVMALPRRFEVQCKSALLNFRWND